MHTIIALLIFIIPAALAFRAMFPKGGRLYQFNTAAPVSPTFKGVATLVWGTAPGGTKVAPVMSGVLVTSISITPENGGPVQKIENEDGSVISRVYLDDGFTAEVEAVYNSALTYPANLAAVTLTLPKAVDLSGGSAVASYPCTLESNPMKFTRKEVAMITFRLAHNPGVEGAGS